MKKKLTIEQRIIIISISITTFLIIVGLLSQDEKTKIGVISNALILFAFMLLLPLIILRYQREKAIREMEEKMPIFLRDLVESLNAGIPFHQAIIASSKVDYGELSKEIKKMANQISWGMPVNKVLDQFIERVKSSKKLYMSLKILRESYFTGGDVISTLNSVADSLTQLNEIEKERVSILNQYVVLIYAIVFIFVAILVAINRLMIPIFHTSEMQEGGITGFLSPCADNPSFVCEIFSIPAATIFGLENPRSLGGYYISVFFYMSTIIALTCGIIVGEIRERSIFSGIKHALILTIAVWGLLLLLKVLNFLGV
ncbi:MAG: type II secretion system F family protein [Candidatus Aenigmatarchaeota archaeon]